MISFLISHAPLFGALFLGYIGGLVRAAHVQLRRENLDKWMDDQRLIDSYVRPPGWPRG